MTTLNPYGYNRNYYTETTGSWVAPSTCFKALVIIAGGGGGGGGASGHGGNPGAGGAGTAGSNGGNTTFVGPNSVSLTSSGGNGGAGGAAPAAATFVPGVQGAGGFNSGNVSANIGGLRNIVASNTVSAFCGIQAALPVLNSFYETHFLPGGIGANSSGQIFSPQTAPATTSQGVVLGSSSPGVGVNSGAAANSGTRSGSSPNAASNGHGQGGGGGYGGNAIGEKYLCKITPGATYTITIGSGGAGGAGGGGGANSSGAPGGGGGGGGASGFCYILWNDVPQGT